MKALDQATFKIFVFKIFVFKIYCVQHIEFKKLHKAIFYKAKHNLNKKYLSN